MDENDPNLLLRVDHVKYRKAGEGRSPIGRLSVYKEYVEWRDNASPEVLTVKFIHIKGQRVSPPHKSKVQLQLVLQNEDQATFVFLNPAHDKETLAKERDNVKETLQQALIAHRAHVNQLAASVEKRSKTAELEEKQKLLRENKTLEQLYKLLVATKLITPQDFWKDYYRKEGITEEKMGINGAFLANIAQQEGTNGIKLNLNPEIIQAIFTTYPAVEKKHLEVVPHEMNESKFWSLFFQSHYFHREREVFPNPKDIFADCTKIDEEEIVKMTSDGVQRKRFDLEHLDDNNLRDLIHKKETIKKSTKETLIKRCNYLSEKILATSWKEGIDKEKKSGFGVLNRVVEECEKRLDSEDLAETSSNEEVQIVRMDEASLVEKNDYTSEEAERYKGIVEEFFSNYTDEEIVCGSNDGFDELLSDMNMDTNEYFDSKDTSEYSSPDKWGLKNSELAEFRDLNNAVVELCKHFWSSFPPLSKEAEEKIERMRSTLKRFENEFLSNAEIKFGSNNIEHCRDMIARAHEKYEVYLSRRRNK